MLTALNLGMFLAECLSIGCPKINETHNISNKYADFNPVAYIFSNLKAVVNNNY